MRCSTSQIPRVSWNPKILCHVHKIPSLVPILNQKNPVNMLPSYYLRFVLISYSYPCLCLPSGLFLQVCLSERCVYFSSWPWVLHALPISSFLFGSYNIWQGVKFMKLLLMQLTLASCYFLLLSPKYFPHNHDLTHL